jgi:hypothetical protein
MGAGGASRPFWTFPDPSRPLRNGISTQQEHAASRQVSCCQTYIRQYTPWCTSHASPLELFAIDIQLRSNNSHRSFRMLCANLITHPGFRHSFTFGRRSPFFVDVPALADALSEVDNVMHVDVSRRGGQHQQQAILLDVKEVRVLLLQQDVIMHVNYFPSTYSMIFMNFVCVCVWFPV